MRRTLFLICLMTMALILHGCDAGAQGATAQPSISELSGGLYPDTGVNTHKSAQVFDNQAEFNNAFARYTTAPIPTIDFTTHRVLLVDMGQRQSGGYAVRVSEVVSTGEGVRAEITYSRPAPNCPVTEAATNPYQILAIQTTEDVLVTERLVTQICQ